jgi:hypothetical protein
MATPRNLQLRVCLPDERRGFGYALRQNLKVKAMSSDVGRYYDTPLVGDKPSQYQPMSIPYVTGIQRLFQTGIMLISGA